MAKLIAAVPDTWSWVDGRLHAPQSLITSGEVVEHTGYSVERFHSIHPTIIGSYEKGSSKRLKPDLFAIIGERKLPGFICFDEAGYESHVVTLPLAKQIAIAYVRRGYRGHLHFYSACIDNSKYQNPERCKIALEPWDGPSALQEEAGENPARIKLEYCTRVHFTNLGGRLENLEPMLWACRELDLREYEPAGVDR